MIYGVQKVIKDLTRAKATIARTEEKGRAATEKDLFSFLEKVVLIHFLLDSHSALRELKVFCYF